MFETYSYGIAVTPSNSDADPAGPFAALFVAKAGNISLIPEGGAGTALALTAVPAGTYIRFPVVRVNTTGTTADVIGLVSSAVTPQGFP